MNNLSEITLLQQQKPNIIPCLLPQYLERLQPFCLFHYRFYQSHKKKDQLPIRTC